MKKPSMDPQALELLRIRVQQTTAFEKMKARVHRRVSTEDDDIFTMFSWPSETLENADTTDVSIQSKNLFSSLESLEMQLRTRGNSRFVPTRTFPNTKGKTAREVV